MKSALHKWIQTSLVVFSFAVLLLGAHNASAGKDDNVFGWWWSDGIGWISLNNCSDPTTCSGSTYGVKINETTNAISGYAWSDNVGWITFNENDWSDNKDVCPPGGCFSGGNQFGFNAWARALNGKYTPHSSDGRDNRGNYDGWIDLTGSNYGFGIDATKNIAATLGNAFKDKVVHPLTGYGWGDTVIGWVQSNSAYHKSFVAFDGKCDPIVDPLCAQKGKLDLSIGGKKTASILGGETVTIDWSAKGNFYPTECTGSLGGSTSPYPDKAWTTKTNGFLYQAQSGKYTSIHVPPSGTTTFRLNCTDGKDVYYEEVEVTAKLTATISGGSCINDLTSNPTLTWTTNDTSPECTITAEPFHNDFTAYKIPSSGYLSASGSAPYTVVDSNYQHKDTFYKLNCANGDTGFKATVGPVTGFTKMCSSAVEYSVTKSDTSCNLVKKDPNSGAYKGSTTTLSLIPNNFTADADVTVDTTNGTPSGTLSLNPLTGFTYNVGKKEYNTIAGDYTISSTELAKIMNSKTFNGKNVESVDLKIVGKSQNTTVHKQSLYYCVDVPPACPNPNDANDPKCAKCPDPNNLLCPCDPMTDPHQCKGVAKPKYVPF